MYINCSTPIITAPATSRHFLHLYTSHCVFPGLLTHVYVPSSRNVISTEQLKAQTDNKSFHNKLRRTYKRVKIPGAVKYFPLLYSLHAAVGVLYG